MPSESDGIGQPYLSVAGRVSSVVAVRTRCGLLRFVVCEVIVRPSTRG